MRIRSVSKLGRLQPRHRRRAAVLATLGIAICLLWLLGPLAMAPILRNHLQGMVAEHLNATLRMGNVSYHFPYGITIDDAALIGKTPEGKPVELCKARRVELSLARLPWGDGPLVFEKLIFTDPVLHLVRTKDGLIGQTGLIKDSGDGAADGSGNQTTNAPQAAEKLSDIFRLRRFKVSGGEVVYEDRSSPNSVPMIWKNLQIDLNTNPTAGVLYAYNLVAQDLPLVDAAASGTMDIDQLVLDVKNFGMKLQVSPDAQQSQLPGEIQELLREHQIDGQLTLNGNALVPLRNPSKTRYDAIIDLSKASAWVPQWDASLDHMVLKVRCSSEAMPSESTSREMADSAISREGQPTAPAESEAKSAGTGDPRSTAPATAPSKLPALPPLRVRIELLEAGSGDTMLRIEKGTALVDPVEGKWHVRQLSGKLHIGSNRAALPTNLQALLQRLNVRGIFEFTARAGGPVRPIPGHRAIDDIDYELITYARDMTVQPPDFPMPIKGIGGVVHMRNKLINLENIQATYGNDRIFLASCRLPLTNVPDEIWLHDIDGNITFGAVPSPAESGPEKAVPNPPATAPSVKAAMESARHYPPAFDPVLSVLRPSGVFFFSGDCVLRRHWALPGSASAAPGEPDHAAENPAGDDNARGDYVLGYRFNLGADSAAFSVGPLRLPVTEVKFIGSFQNAAIAPDTGSGNPDPTAGEGDVPNFQARLFGGTLAVAAQIHTGRVFTYNARMEINRLDLQKFADACNAASATPSTPGSPVSSASAAQPLRLSGDAYANMLVSGNGPRNDRTLLDNLRAKGEFEVLQGDFWQAPLVKDIIAGVKVARDALTVGQAAATFEIYDQKIVLTNAAISAPVLGLQGAGEIHFDGQVDARVVVAPLGDWRDKLKQSKIPIVSDAAGAVAGALQKLLNSASGALFYEFRVTGTLAHPSLSTIPAPILTDSAAALFGSMLNPGSDDHLITVIRRDTLKSSSPSASPAKTKSSSQSK